MLFLLLQLYKEERKPHFSCLWYWIRRQPSFANTAIMATSLLSLSELHSVCAEGMEESGEQCTVVFALVGGIADRATATTHTLTSRFRNN
jgi:hypothetical protein